MGGRHERLHSQPDRIKKTYERKRCNPDQLLPVIHEE
jgi:hypothetical protein